MIFSIALTAPSHARSTDFLPSAKSSASFWAQTMATFWVSFAHTALPLMGAGEYG
jgi:hypothetical protein